MENNCIFSRRVYCQGKHDCNNCNLNPMQFISWVILTVDQSYNSEESIQEKAKHISN